MGKYLIRDRPKRNLKVDKLSRDRASVSRKILTPKPILSMD